MRKLRTILFLFLLTFVSSTSIALSELRHSEGGIPWDRDHIDFFKFSKIHFEVISANEYPGIKSEKICAQIISFMEKNKSDYEVSGCRKNTPYADKTDLLMVTITVMDRNFPSVTKKSELGKVPSLQDLSKRKDYANVRIELERYNPRRTLPEAVIERQINLNDSPEHIETFLMQAVMGFTSFIEIKK